MTRAQADAILVKFKRRWESTNSPFSQEERDESYLRFTQSQARVNADVTRMPDYSYYAERINRAYYSV